MLPNSALSSTVLAASFESPRDTDKLALEDYDLGGVAIEDATQGLLVRTWRYFVDGNNVMVESPPNVAPALVFTQPGIIELAGTFDQAMRTFVAYSTASGAFFRWYDTLTQQFVVTQLPAGSTNLRCQLDDKRQSQATTSDILLAYVRGNSLYYRQQRDRYTVEYLLGSALPAGALEQIGMNRIGRFQFLFRPAG